MTCHLGAATGPRQGATARAIAEADRAGEEAKRILAAMQAEGRAPFTPMTGRPGGYTPYQNPPDQSIYLEGIA